MRRLVAHIEGVGLVGPGLPDWASAREMLSGRKAYVSQPTVVPVPEGLPAAERRRVGRIVKIALAVGTQAIREARVNPAELRSVFTSSGGDGQNCHEICTVLAQDDRQLSPTRFHNSVHNAAAGYWSIANGATVPSNAVCAFDASFAAGLLESITQVTVERRPVLLVAYDAAYPSPLDEKRPMADAFGVALVLAPEGQGEAASSPGARGVRIRVSLADVAAEHLNDPKLESLRTSIPAARSLPLLLQLARQEPGRVGVEYLDGRSLAIEVL